MKLKLSYIQILIVGGGGPEFESPFWLGFFGSEILIKYLERGATLLFYRKKNIFHVNYHYPYKLDP